MTRAPHETDWPTRVEPDIPTSVVVTDAPPPRRSPVDDLWPWLLALGVLVLAGVAALWWFGVHERRHASSPPTASTQTVPPAPAATPKVTLAAPGLVGMTRARAAARARELGLIPRVHPVRSGAAPGRVVAQRPAPGTKLARGGTVVLDVAQVPATAAVPDVTGRSAADAVTALRRAGFTAAVVGVPSSEREGTVVAESPSAGTKARSGTSVRVNISKGRPTPASTTTTASTPPATRSSTTTASTPTATRSSTTTSAPVTTSATTTAPAPIPPQPSSGGPTVPSVLGDAQTDAIAAIEQAGLGAHVTLVQGQQPAGTVTAAEPAAGKRAQRGSTVTLKVSLGPDPAQSATVPDVTGQDETAATQALEDAGFSVETVARKAGGSTRGGQVVDVLPAGDAPQGWTITLVVAG